MYLDCEKVIKFIFFSILSTVICKENKFGYCLKKKKQMRETGRVFSIMGIEFLLHHFLPRWKNKLANANDTFYYHRVLA